MNGARGARVAPLVRADLWSALGVAGAVALLGIVPAIVLPGFYFFDDTAGGAFGQWYELGQRILAGDSLLLNLDAWMAGNWTVEQMGILNPVTLAISVGSTWTSNALVYATAVKLAFMALGGAGTYMLARSYAAKLPWAILAGIAAPLAGFTLYLDATSWVTNLQVWAYFTWTFWALRRFAYSHRSIIPAFIFGYLLITVAYVHGTIALIFLFMAMLVETIAARNWHQVARVLAIGTALGILTLAVYLPAMLSSSVSVRETGIHNDSFMTLTLNGLAVSNVPAAEADFTGFWGRFTPIPYVYIAWFLPLIALVDLQKLRRIGGELIGLVTLGVLTLALATGPSQLGPLRFPARMLPWLALTLIVLAVVLVSRATNPEKLGYPRLGLLLVIQGFTYWLAIAAVTESAYGLVKYFGVTTAALICIFFFLRQGKHALGASVAIATTVVVLVLQSAQFAPNSQHFGQGGFPAGVDHYTSMLPEGVGEGVVVGGPFPSGFPRWSQTLAGNMWYLVDNVQMINLYSPSGFLAFNNDLCLNPYYGFTCDDLVDRLFTADETTGLPIADLLSIDTVQMVAGKETPIETLLARTTPAGWSVASTGAADVVWVRDEPTGEPGGVVWASDGLQIEVHEERATSVTFTASGDGGQVVFSRLDWPGYKVTGAELADPLRGYLVTVDVPSGTHEVTLSFTPPGWTFSAAALILAVLAAGALAILDSRRRRPAELSPAD